MHAGDGEVGEVVVTSFNADYPMIRLKMTVSGDVMTMCRSLTARANYRRREIAAIPQKRTLELSRVTRLHRANIIADVFGGAKPIHQALARFKAEGRGVLILLRDGTGSFLYRSPPTPRRVKHAPGNGAKWVFGAQILKDLGVTSIRLLTTSRPMSVSPVSASRSPERS
jgi:GTP cyclohydrolase II